MRCLDVFQRPDGSFGFEEYRRDPEDPQGWYPVGGHAGQRFANAADALSQAQTDVPWLKAVL